MENKRSTSDLENITSFLRQSEPRLKDPDRLTDDIMQEIARKKPSQQGPTPEKKKPNRIITVASRMLAAASICLFFIFGYEQYLIVDKIASLEDQNASISRQKKYQTAIATSQVIGLLKSDPELLKQLRQFNEDDPPKLKLLKAGLIYNILTTTNIDSTHKNLVK
jgi:hypothetical protein